MRNLIFVTVFHDRKCLEMFYIFLESLLVFGELDERTDILIYTSPGFKHEIITNNWDTYGNFLFHTSDTINDINRACKARLDLMNIPCVASYSKILYLDTDILIKSSINKVFDLIVQEDMLYALEEGSVDDGSHGVQFFQEIEHGKSPRSAFSSGIMGFRMSPKIHLLFEKINQHMSKDHRVFSTHDQPFIVFNAFLLDMFDNQEFKSVVINRPPDISSGHVIFHYCGDIGNFQRKIDIMRAHLSILKNEVIVSIESQTREIINNQLVPIIRQIGEPLEGNLFMEHRTLNYTDIYKEKRQNMIGLLMLTRKRPHPLHILEIGFNAGFSSLLMLLTDANAHLTCLDICDHKYTLPCFKVISGMFGDRITLIKGSSIEQLPLIDRTFDLIHVDGGHTDPVVNNDCIHTVRLSKPGTIIVMDDYDFANIHRIWDATCKTHNLQPISSHIFNTLKQDMRIVIQD